MNRKLLNGLLVLAVAAGGVGTFTSCKDENFRNQVLVGQEVLQAQIDAIRGVSDEQFKENLKTWLNNWTNEASKGGFSGYEDMVQASDAMYSIYQSILSDGPLTDAAQEYIDALYRWLFDGEGINKSDWYEMIDALANKRASSIDINQTINPVFGSINLPIGLKTTVLSSYMFKGTGVDYVFPTQIGDQSHLAIEPSEAEKASLAVIKDLNPSGAQNLSEANYTMAAGYGNMGAVYANINPSSIDFSANPKVQLVNSLDEVLLDAQDGDLVVENNTDLLSFGYTRGTQTGVYKINANVSANYKGVTVDLDKTVDYVSDIKEAIYDKSISNIAYLGEILYKKINNLLPAYALKVWWEEPVLGTTNETIINSVHSSFDLAAAVIHPLSYGTDVQAALGQAGLNRRLPMFSPLREYLETIGNKLSISFEEIEPIKDVNIDLYLTIADGYVYAYYDDDHTTPAACFPYDLNGIIIPNGALDSLLNAILDGADWELNDAINEQIVAQVNDAIDEINKNLALYNAKVGDFLSFIEDSKYYDVASRLVDIYNDFAKRVNHVLENPNHYLQVAAIYSAGDGRYHHLSTDPKDPTRVAPANGGDAIEILASSYTGDVVVPSYAKYVAITGINGGPAKISDNAKAGEKVNTVLPGQVHRVPVKVNGFNSGDVLTITYVSVDYHGVCSMQNYYVMVK